MPFEGFDIYDKLKPDMKGYRRMPICESVLTSPYSVIPEQGAIISPEKKVKYFPVTLTKHTTYIHAAQNVTSLYKAIRAVMPINSTLSHWIRLSYIDPDTGLLSYTSTFVSENAYLSVQFFHDIVCEIERNSGIDQDDIITLITIEIVVREFINV